MPKIFRDRLQPAGGALAGIYIYPLFTHPALAACDEEFMSQVADSLDNLAMFSQEQHEFASVLLGSAQYLPLDPEGRIVLPTELIERAHIDGEALFVGQGNRRFQVWNPALWRESRDLAIERLRTQERTLPLSSPRIPEG